MKQKRVCVLFPTSVSPHPTACAPCSAPSPPAASVLRGSSPSDVAPDELPTAKDEDAACARAARSLCGAGRMLEFVTQELPVVEEAVARAEEVRRTQWAGSFRARCVWRGATAARPPPPMSPSITVHTHTHTHTHTHAHAHAHTNTHSHTCTHTHTRTKGASAFEHFTCVPEAILALLLPHTAARPPESAGRLGAGIFLVAASLFIGALSVVDGGVSERRHRLAPDGDGAG